MHGLTHPLEAIALTILFLATLAALVLWACNRAGQLTEDEGEFGDWPSIPRDLSTINHEGD